MFHNKYSIMKGLLALLLVMIPSMYVVSKDDVVRRIDCSSFIRFSTKKSTEMTLGLSQPHRLLSISSGEAHKAFFAPTDYLILDNFPVTESGTSTLHLKRKTNTVIDPNTLWHLGNGKVVPTPPMQFYTGFDEKDPKSKVLIMYANGELVGSIRSSDGKVRTLNPNWASNEMKGEHLLAISDGSEVLKGFQCYADQFTSHTSQNSGEDKAQSDALVVPTFGDLLEVDVAFEMDYPVYLKIKKSNMTEEQGIANTIVYVAALLAQSSTMYEDEINVTLKLAPDPYVWLSEDDPGYPGYQDVKTDAGAILSRFANRRKTQSDVRDIAHLVTSVVGTGGAFAAGVAYSGDSYSGTICNKFQGYGISSINVDVRWPTLNYMWDAMVCTHEMGHNFGGPHTHYCKSDSPWPNKIPLDTCVVAQGSLPIDDGCNIKESMRSCPEGGGTIMSYCHLLPGCPVRLEFTPVVANQLRKAADRAKSNCVSVPSKPTVKLQYPLGRNSFKGGSKDTLRFFSQNVTMVKAEYSLDNMKTWKEIENSVPASSRRIAWNIPSENTSEGFVRVFDANNPSIGDTSWVAFSIISKQLVLTSQFDGRLFGQRETIPVEWKQTLLTEVIVELSTDGGNQWTELKKVTSSQSATSGSFDWKPGSSVEGTTIRLRVRTSDNVLVSQTGNFTIAKEKMYIIEPTGGETLCAGKQFELRWWGENFGMETSVLRIEYSVDDGKTWTRVSGTSSKVLDGKRNWTVPSAIGNTSEGRVRMFFQDGSDTVTKVMSEKIVFSSAANCQVLSVQDLSTDFNSYEVTPNPAKDNVHFSFSVNKVLDGLSIKLYDLNGSLVRSLYDEKNTLKGNIDFSANVTDLPSGSYSVYIVSGEKSFTVPLVISH